MSNKFVELEPRDFLNENWKQINKIPKLKTMDYAPYGPHGNNGIWIGEEKKRRRAIMGGDRWPDRFTEKEKIWIRWITYTRIEIAEAAKTKEIGSDKKYKYFESEIGMNIIVPKGRIEKMRFKVSLIAEDKVVAIDGFPKDVIDNKYILGGKIKVAISKAFMFVPVIGPTLSEILEIEFNPWEFKLGSLKKINIDFSGGLTSKPEWYFKDDGIKNDLRVALTIRKPKRAKYIKGKIKAAWLYDPGFLRKARIGTDAKNIKIY